MVNGQLVSLASLGITSIDLTAKSSGQTFSDGSTITGTTTYTKSDGTTGAVGDAVLATDTNGYITKSTVVTNADQSTANSVVAYNADGSLAFHGLGLSLQGVGALIDVPQPDFILLHSIAPPVASHGSIARTHRR